MLDYEKIQKERKKLIRHEIRKCKIALLKNFLNGKDADVRVFVECERKTYEGVKKYFEERGYQVYGIVCPWPSIMISFPKEKAFPPIL